MVNISNKNVMDILSKMMFENLEDIESVLTSIGFKKEIFYRPVPCGEESLIRYSSAEYNLDCFIVCDSKYSVWRLYAIPCVIK